MSHFSNFLGKPPIFNSLPPEFQDILRLAQDTYNVEVIPLQELKGGRMGAGLYLVSVASLDSDKVQHLVLKLDHKSNKTKFIASNCLPFAACQFDEAESWMPGPGQSEPNMALSATRSSQG